VLAFPFFLAPQLSTIALDVYYFHMLDKNQEEGELSS